MRAKRMIAKHGGDCCNCKRPIVPGQTILWVRGRPAVHADCQVAKFYASSCTACGGSGRTWNNANCGQCDGTGARKVQDFAKAGGHTPDATDVAYEDDCARRCGL